MNINNMSTKKPIIKSFGTFLTNVPAVAEQAKGFVVGAVSPREIEQIHLPINFDGRKVWKDYLSPIKTQGECGMCYSCSTVSSLADRYAILTLNMVHVKLSASDMVMCETVDPKFTASQIGFSKSFSEDYHKAEVETREKFACNGNTLYNAGKYLFIKGAPSEACIPDNIVTSSDAAKNVPFCENVEGNDFDTCVDKKTAQQFYRAGKAYQLDYNKDDQEGTEKNIMYDLYKWGPLAAGFIIFDDFLSNYDGTTIYTVKGESGKATLGHAIRLVGWGEEQQGGRLVKYWIAANSWGADWGDQGYFKVERFLSGIDLEKNTMALIPDLPGIPNLDVFSTTGYITDDDRNARRKLGVGLYNLYPSTAIEKIQSGILLGNLTDIVILPHRLPADYSSFIAAKVDTYNISDIIDKSGLCTEKSNNTWWWIAFIILSFVTGVITAYFYLKWINRW